MAKASGGVFERALREANPAERTPRGAGGRRWVFVNEDQLTDAVGPLAALKPADAGVVLIESRWKAGLRPYHRQRLALIWANQRHFALEQARRGVAVRYVQADTPYRDALAPLAGELGGLTMMQAAERETREDLRPLVDSGALTVVPHDGWLTTPDDFAKSHRGPPWKMDSFYRYVRRRTGLLMEGADGEDFVGGKVSFDAENRRPWRGPPEDPPAAEVPSFEPDAVTREVVELVERAFARHPGVLRADALPATLADAEALWAWAKRACLRHFGPFEDAMSVRSRTLFHTRVSALMNLHRLLPARVVREAAELPIPLASKEGFIRQVLGWREFVRHVHESTEGFRVLRGERVAVGAGPGDGGYARWAGKPWAAAPSGPVDLGGATPSHLGGDTPLPPAWWGAASGMNCLDTVVRAVWEEAYSHHITRLMVLSNLATLLDVSPRELTDWFWVAYADAWDWVVEPNVLAMGTYGTGGVMTTKPYVAGAAYIDKMSDYCESCQFDPRKDCPITRLYWAFLERHAGTLRKNPRLFMPMNALAKRSAELKRGDAATFVAVRDVLVRGERLRVPTDAAGGGLF